MNCNNRNTIRTLRNKALVGAIVAALALGSAVGASAQTADLSLDHANPSWAQTLSLLNYLQGVSSAQLMSGDVGATLGAGDSIFITNTGSGQPMDNHLSTLSALAIGNSAPTTTSAQNPAGLAGNAIDLELLDADGFGNSGLGILSGQLFDGGANNAAVTTNVSGVSILTTLTGYAAGNVTHSDGQILSEVRVNDASNEISGNLPGGTPFAGTTGGSASIASIQSTVLPALLTMANAGDITIGNTQINNQGATASGVTLNNSVINVTDTVGATASFSNSGNTIAGRYTGNRASSSFNAEGSNGALSYNGSVVVANGQHNINAAPTLVMTGDAIGTDIGGNLTGAGSITQSNDTISGAVQGNLAANAITFADGISIDGDAAGPASALDLGFAVGAPFVRTSSAGDLVLLNMQRNGRGGTGGTISAAITAPANGGITATADGLTSAGSAITLDNDHVSASARGNDATNGVRADGASFDALVSVGNLQVDERTGYSAAVTGINVRANLDASNGNQGDVSVGGSSIGASAQANQANTDVDVGGTAFTSGANLVATASTDMPVNNYIHGATTDAGVSVGNVQASYGFGTPTSITATNTDSWLGANYAGTLTGGSSTVNGNAILATAGDNAATTGARLHGTNGTFSAALFNTQFTADTTVAGTITDAFLGVDAGSGVANATLTANSNTLGANTNGNQATNTLSTDFTNATAGAGGGWTDDSVAVTPSGMTTPNSAHGTLALASTQLTRDTGFTASETNGQIGVTVGGTTTNTPTTVNGNTASANAMANQVSNTLDPGVGNLSAVGGEAAQVASLSNFQYADNNAVSASVTRSGATPAEAIGAMFLGNLTGPGGVTVSSNTVSAFSAGTMAGNSIAVSGTNYAPAAAPGGLHTDGNTEVGSTLVRANAAYTLLNAQGGDGGSRTSTVTNTGIDAVAAGNVSNSPLTVSDNDIGADARDNYANNSLSFSGFSTLTSTGALVNTQGSNPGGATTAVNGNVSNTYVAAGSLGGTVAGSDVTVSGNDISAKGIANTGINSLAVVAGNLAGSSIDPNGLPELLDRGAVFTGAGFETLADFGLTSVQIRNGTVGASITGGGIGGGADGTFNGGSLTVANNTQTALAQSNSATNGLGMQVTSADVSAAINNQQQVATASDATASVTSDTAFAAFAGAALGTASAVPVTVSDNTLIAQAGLNTASNALNVNATSAINGTGVTTTGASTDTVMAAGYTGAIGDYSVYNNQSVLSGAAATANAGLVGIQGGAAGAGIGTNAAVSGLTVGSNQIASQVSGNNAGNSISLSGASSVSATTALNNTQATGEDTFTATTTGTSVGIYDAATTGDINRANLDVSGNSLNAGASGNSASNSISVLPVALNASFNQATLGAVTALGSTAGASNALLNSQSNASAISATVSNSNIGVDSGTPGTAGAALLNSVATVGGNSASASASGNSAGNQILLASLPTGVASSALVSNQVNSANITATANNVHIGVNAGATSSSPVTVSGNTIGAVGVGNSATNHIGIGN